MSKIEELLGRAVRLRDWPGSAAHAVCCGRPYGFPSVAAAGAAEDLP